MRSNSEYQNLGFPSLADYLFSDQMESQGSFGTNLTLDGHGSVILSLSKAKSGMSHYYLFLKSAAGEVDPVPSKLLEGKRGDGQVRFNLTGLAQELAQISPNWSCFFALENETEFLVARLRVNGTPAALLPVEKTADQVPAERPKGRLGRLKALFGASTTAAPQKTEPSVPAPSFVLWSDDKRLYDTGLSAGTPEGSAKMLLQANAKTNNLSIVYLQADSARRLLGGGVLHRASSQQELQSYPYDFSIVMAVYNVEDYLEEAVDSVIEQDIGFEEHVQLILVDDGSLDGSGAICDRYKEQYPDNIVVIHQKNGGVASARNAGLTLATGRFVNFMDSDDKFSPNTFSLVGEFLNSYSHLVDVACVPLYFFEASSGPYWQNYKFERGTRIIDLWTEWNISDMNTNSSFIRLETAKKFKFDPMLPTGEDLKYLVCVLLEKMKLGVVAEGLYWYRRRNAGGSLINTSHSKRSWYFEYFTNLSYELIEYSKKKYGFAPDYVQNTVMMDLQWRFHVKEFPEGILNDKEKQQYRANLTRALQMIDDKIIFEQLKLNIEQQLQLYCMKYQTQPELVYTTDNIHILVNHIHLCDCSLMGTYFDFIRLENAQLYLEGSSMLTGLPEGTEVNLYFFVAGDYYPCERVHREFETSNCFGTTKRLLGFRCSIPLLPQYYGKAIRLAMVIDGHLVLKRAYSYRKFTPFFGRIANQYYYKDGFVVKVGKSRITFAPAEHERSQYEAEFLSSLKELMVPEDALALTNLTVEHPLSGEMYKQIVNLRSYALNHKKERPIWLISDRPLYAGDNGEALFRYLMEHKEELPVDVFFVLSRESADYEALSAIGPVLDYDSPEHLRTQLQADVIISSQGDDYVFTPFSRTALVYSVRKYYADLLSDQKLVFLQHGVTKDDISDWLNRYNKNFSGFVTTNQRETQSILDYNFYYTPKQVWFTGFPRFDRLYEDNKQQVVICPTWRHYLRDLTPAQFVQCSYYRFYSSLFSNERLHAALRQKGYRLCVRLHPSMLQFLDCFQGMNHVEVLDPGIPYRQIFAESSLLLTDYSSVFMDFAYLRKPVIYSQFDREEFFGGHIYTPGYFDYDTDGFGPVTKTVDETVDAMIDLLERDCQMAPEYLKRVNDFFPVNDYHNSERVYHKLLELMENN